MTTRIQNRANPDVIYVESKMNLRFSRRRALLVLGLLLATFLVLALFSSVLETRRPRRRLLASAAHAPTRAEESSERFRAVKDFSLFCCLIVSHSQVHLDLKGAPPSLDYLLQVCRLMSSAVV